MEQLSIFGESERIDNRLMDYEKKIDHAKQVLRVASDISYTYYHKPLIITYSGGKDSDVMLNLAIKSGIDFEVLHSVTTVDAPDTKQNKPVEEEDVFDCTLIKNAKENKGLICNPIYNFTDIEVWRYIRQNEIEVNPLYEKGFKRIGCIGCPLGGAKNMRKEFSMFPAFKERYIIAFDRMMDKRREKGKDDVTGKQGYNRWETGQDVFNWWIDSQDTIFGQTSLFEE